MKEGQIISIKIADNNSQPFYYNKVPKAWIKRIKKKNIKILNTFVVDGINYDDDSIQIIIK